MNSNSLDLRDYLDATSDASKRTRTVMIVLVVASVLAFVGFLNSYRYSWMLARIGKLSKFDDPYVIEKLQFPPGSIPDERYHAFYTAVVRSYVENAYTIRVPFFGFAFDVNDLGLLAGIGFVVILIWLSFALRSEIVNLRLAFKGARKQAAGDPALLATFYDLLAMRQVFTLPHLEDNEKIWKTPKSWLLGFLSKASCFLPAFVYAIVATHDFLTIKIGKDLDFNRAQVLVGYTLFFGVVTTALAIWCYRKWITIDKLWVQFWDDVDSQTKD